jgi:50S ribosomal protein L16 3-hydroxylase
MTIVGRNEAGLLSLIRPRTIEEFVNTYWGRRHLAFGGSIENTPVFAEQLSTFNSRDILRVADNPIIVMHRTTEGYYRGSRVFASDAFHFYEAGNALYFNLANSFSDVKRWKEALADDLGQPPNRCQASIFITPRKWVTETHFDPNENFTVQLRGRKIWRIGANCEIPNPLDRVTSSLEIPAHMKAYCHRSKVEPNDLEFIEEVGPRSVLYVPRGYWHSVESLDESISLNFSIDPETWETFLIALLSRVFLTDPDLRASTTSAARNLSLREQARALFNSKLEIATHLLRDLRPEHVFPLPSSETTVPCPGDDEIIKRNRLATVTISQGHSDNCKLTIISAVGVDLQASFDTSQNQKHGERSRKVLLETQIAIRDVKVIDWIMAQDTARSWTEWTENQS